MWGVTVADLSYRYRQFLIAVVGAGLVLAMGLLLAGLVGGFSAEIHQTVGAVGAQRWVLSKSAQGQVTSVGVFPQADEAAIAASPGVRSTAPLAVVPEQVATILGQSATVNVIGVRVGGLGDPEPTAGHALTGPGQVVADTGTGAPVGSYIILGTKPFLVVGQVQDRTLNGGIPVLYTTLRDAQSIALGGRPLITAVVTEGVPARVPAGLTVLTNGEVERDTLMSLNSAISSVNNSKILMWAIAAVIVAALLYVSALQRVRDFAVLKALGSSSAALFGSLALQSVVVTLVAAIFAIIISNFMGGLFAQPVAIPGSAFATLPAVAVVVGLLSSLVAIRRVTAADPVSAFGGP